MISKLSKYDIYDKLGIAGVCVWLVFIFLSLFQSLTNHTIFIAIIFSELILRVFFIHLSFTQYKKFSSRDKKIFIWLVAYTVAGLASDISWVTTIDILQMTIIGPWHSFIIVSYFSSLLFLFGFIAKILTLHTIPVKKFILFFFGMAFVDVMLMLIFMSHLHWDITLSVRDLYGISTGVGEMVIFDLAIFVLIFCRETWLFLFFSGVLINLMDQFVIKYSFITENFSLYLFIEIVWMAGIVLNYFGLISLKNSERFLIKNWLRSAYSIKSRLIISMFGVSITSLIGFAAFAYFFSSISAEIFKELLFFIMFYSVVIITLSFFIGRKFEILFKKLEKNIKNYSSNSTSNYIDNNFSIEEFVFLDGFVKESIDNHLKKELAEKKLVETASQVAHDIRSPLIVLKSILRNLQFLPESERIEVRNAIQRVSDIANNLLIEYRDENKNQSFNACSEPAALILESIVSEKRIQVENSDVKINLNIAFEMYKVFICVDIIGFKRVISNLVNNAIESFKGFPGQIEVSLNKKKEKVIISIMDNGCGISNEKLELILQTGGSFDKEGGAGLGLPYSIGKIKEWGGSFSLVSELNKGTLFDIILNQSEPNSWFMSEIYLSENSAIIVLDDDEYIHRIWSKKFNEKFLLKHNITLMHFNCYEKFINFFKENAIDNSVFFIDYDLGNSQVTGLDIIKQLKIGDKATLVTSRYEDQEIRKDCQKVKIKIIPKFFAEIISVDVVGLSNVVLIDDDATIAYYWKEAAEAVGKKLSIFSNSEDFIKVAHFYSKKTTIYIDSSLSQGVKGEDFAKILYDIGYHNLILATGHPRSHFQQVTWVKDIIGKEPPWWSAD